MRNLQCFTLIIPIPLDYSSKKPIKSHISPVLSLSLSLSLSLRLWVTFGLFSSVEAMPLTNSFECLPKLRPNWKWDSEDRNTWCVCPLIWVLSEYFCKTMNTRRGRYKRWVRSRGEKLSWKVWMRRKKTLKSTFNKVIRPVLCVLCVCSSYNYLNIFFHSIHGQNRTDRTEPRI